MMRRCLIKNQMIRVFNLPTWRSSNKPLPSALERLAVMLSIPQFRQTAEHRSVINRIASFELIKKRLDRNSSAPAHIKLYRETPFGCNINIDVSHYAAKLRSSSSTAGSPVKSKAGRTFAAIPKSIIQTSPGLMPRIVVLQAIKHQCAFKR